MSFLQVNLELEVSEGAGHSDFCLTWGITAFVGSADDWLLLETFRKDVYTLFMFLYQYEVLVTK